METTNSEPVGLTEAEAKAAAKHFNDQTKLIPAHQRNDRVRVAVPIEGTDRWTTQDQ